jgi:uncharacterized membrane protein (UPF0127 family)
MQARRFRGLGRAEALGREVIVASGPRARLLGLALLDRSTAGPGLLIPSCRSVHTFGMRFSIDVFFLDREGCVLRREREVGPGRILACAGASAVLELPATTSNPCVAAGNLYEPRKGEERRHEHLRQADRTRQEGRR